MATQELSLSRTREQSELEKIKVLEETRSDLEAEVEKLEKQMKQLEILPSDIEQLAKVHIHVYSIHVYVYVCKPAAICGPNIYISNGAHLCIAFALLALACLSAVIKYISAIGTINVFLRSFILSYIYFLTQVNSESTWNSNIKTHKNSQIVKGEALSAPPKEGKAVRKRNQCWGWCPPLFLCIVKMATCKLTTKVCHLPHDLEFYTSMKGSNTRTHTDL